jgi:hypothetical protein
MASTIQCPSCHTSAPAKGQFCPRCGKALHAPARQPAPANTPAGAAPQSPTPPINLAKAGPVIPMAGLLFLIGLVLGPAGIIAGIVWSSAFLLYAGVALSVVVVIVLILGHFF